MKPSETTLMPGCDCTVRGSLNVANRRRRLPYGWKRHSMLSQDEESSTRRYAMIWRSARILGISPGRKLSVRN